MVERLLTDKRAVRAVGEALLETDRASMSQRFASDALDVAVADLRTLVKRLTPFLGALVGIVLTRATERHGLTVSDPHTPSASPPREPLVLSDGELDFDAESLVHWPAGTLADVPLVTKLVATHETLRDFVAYSAPSDSIAARQAVRSALRQAREDDNPLRGNHLLATAPHGDIHLDAQPRPAASRDEVRFRQDVWDEVDVNVHRHLARGPALKGLGLGLRRGLLLHGPPGTGKTHLGRIIASEVAGKATTIVVDRKALTTCVGDVYDYAARLAPTIVFIEDIDLVAGNRGKTASAELQSLLQALDGPLSRNRCVITVATTNDVTALDAAAVRASRFDRVVEVPRPDTEGRAMILRRYAATLPEHDDLDVHRIAMITTGATGSDLREIFRHALLSTDGPISTTTLLAAAAARGFGQQEAHAAYL